jgi:two-component system OmpR family sensor kinase
MGKTGVLSPSPFATGRAICRSCTVPDDFALVPTSQHGPGVRGTLVVAVGLGPVSHAAGRFAVTAVAIGGAVIVALAVLAAVLLRASLRPLGELAVSARAVAARGAHGRLGGSGPGSETARIARSLNLMLSQAAEAARAHADGEAAARRREERMRRGVVDACHGLREPLAVINGSADYCRSGPRAPGGLDRMIKRVEDQASRMGAIAGALRMTAEASRDRHRTGHTGQAGQAP